MALPKDFAEELKGMIQTAVKEVMDELPPEEDEELLGEQELPLEDEELDPELDENGDPIAAAPPVEVPPTEDPAAAAQVVADVITDAAQAVVAQIQDETGENLDLDAEPVDPLEDEEDETMAWAGGRLRGRASKQMDRRLKALEHKLELDAAGKVLESRLSRSRLPAPFQKVIREQFAGRTFPAQELDTMINRMKEAAVAVDPTGRVRGAGSARNGRGGQISVGMTGLEQAEVEFLRHVAGNSRFRQLESVEDRYVQERLHTDAYKSWVKAGRPNQYEPRLSSLVYKLFGGNPWLDDRAMEAVTTSGMTSIIKNTLNLILAANYAQRHQWWTPIVKEEEVDTIDDATLVRVYGMNTLDVVDEGQAYSELAWADEEETATFVKKGNFVGVTLETLLSDKLNIIRTIPDRLSTSWYNTISALVSNVFTLNTAAGPVLADTGALFNATAAGTPGGHVNLLTTAFSVSAFDAVYTAMQKQTDQTLGTGQRLLITPKYVLGPPDIRASALQVRNSELIPGSVNNDINPYQGEFEFVPVPNWTDADNWAAVADPSLFPAIWLIFLRGRAVPELFTADSETGGAMFTNDTIRYKVRMLTFRYSSTYDCAPVSDFRPLHKSNV